MINARRCSLKSVLKTSKYLVGLTMRKFHLLLESNLCYLCSPGRFGLFTSPAPLAISDV